MENEKPINHFVELAAINVNSQTEKKGKFTYLSWAWAVDQLMRQDGQATWNYSDPVKFGDTMMVFCTVTAFGKSMTAQLPVLDYQNNAIEFPDSFAVNTAMQRCLAKAISLHGLGLYIYAGEDIPLTPPEPTIDFNTTPCAVISVTEKKSLATSDKKDGELWTAWISELSDGRKPGTYDKNAADLLELIRGDKKECLVVCGPGKHERSLEIIEINGGKELIWVKP